jgi:tripartite-type tricarboxylate transporter receptor subunit TctC
METNRGGLVRALAVTTGERYPLAPEIPTLMESGVHDYVVDGGTVLLAPAGLPAPVLVRLNGTVNNALARPNVKARLASVGVIPVGGTQTLTRDGLARDTSMWRNLIKERDIHFER